MRTFMVLFCFIFIEINSIQAQHLDSLFNDQEKKNPFKLRHAEPLYIDLIRDLGAHKGEREWNIGFGMVDKLRFDKYHALVEYEWAPADRLGLEIELPITYYTLPPNGLAQERPSNRLESIKTAAQWTFHVSQRFRSSFALGYINELEFADLNIISWSKPFQGNQFNPFFITAKQLGRDFHTLLYTGPQFHLDIASNEWKKQFELNINFHYMIPESRNFIGIEFNSLFQKDNFEMVIRPQMRLVIQESLMVGIVQGIPVSKERERLSTFLRLIYEPRHK